MEGSSSQTSPQDQVAARFVPCAGGVIHPARVSVEMGDTFERVTDWVMQGAGRLIGHAPIWARLYRQDQTAGLIAVLHSPTPDGEADLIVVAQRGMVSRSALRFLSGWAFGSAGLRRVVVRIRADRPDHQDLIRRAGFRHEGIARGYFADGADASVWGLHHSDCRWLHRRPLAIPTANTSPASSQRAH